MNLSGIELRGDYRVKFEDWWFNVYDEKGKLIYTEFRDGDWSRREYDENGNVIYYVTKQGRWAKWEYDSNGNRLYFENNSGLIIDERAKELTIEEIEKLLGYKIKIKGEDK